MTEIEIRMKTKPNSLEIVCQSEPWGAFQALQERSRSFWPQHLSFFI